MSPDPDTVSRLTTDCPSVARMAGGAHGEIATYLPGRRVQGVRILEDRVEVHVVARWRASLPGVAEEVRRSLRPVVGVVPVEVYIDDIEPPETSAEDIGAAQGR